MTDLISSEDLKTYDDVLHDADDSRISSLVTMVSGVIREETGRSILEEERTERVDGGGHTLELTNYPIVSVSEILDTFQDNPDPVSSDAYDVSDEEGLIYRRGKGRDVVEASARKSNLSRRGKAIWRDGSARWKVTYTGGFGTSQDDVPDDLRSAALQLATFWYENPDVSVVSERLGDKQVKRELKDAMPPAVARILTKYEADTEEF